MNCLRHLFAPARRPLTALQKKFEPIFATKPLVSSDGSVCYLLGDRGGEHLLFVRVDVGEEKLDSRLVRRRGRLLDVGGFGLVSQGVGYAMRCGF